MTGSVKTVLTPTGSVLERVLDTRSRAAYDGLDPQAYRRLFAAQQKSMWGRHCLRLSALAEGQDILASAEWYDLAGVLDGRSLRICGIRRVWTAPSRSGLGEARMLVDAIFANAVEQGAQMGLVISDAEPDDAVGSGFETIRFTDLTLAVAQSPRHGAPMATVRAGEVRDLGAIAAMGNVRAAPFRFHFERDADFVQYVITAKRLLAGLVAANRRTLQFFIVEEGITAAAYVGTECRRRRLDYRGVRRSRSVRRARGCAAASVDRAGAGQGAADDPRSLPGRVPPASDEHHVVRAFDTKHQPTDAEGRRRRAIAVV